MTWVANKVVPCKAKKESSTLMNSMYLFKILYRVLL